ncbi:MAG: NAD(P)H-dependent oxidoreductase [Pseudomonadota bacterium]
MRALVVYSHPCPESYNAAVRDQVIAALKKSGYKVRLLDLYAVGFDPVMSAHERRAYHDEGINEAPVADHLDHLFWCDTLVFVYPTWWFGLPAMLKGWVERIFVPHRTFRIPTKTETMEGRVKHVRRIAVITTCGATWWLSKVIGEPGRKTLLRGIRALCHPRCKTLYMAHYKMDSSTPESRTAYLQRVERRLAKF